MYTTVRKKGLRKWLSRPYVLSGRPEILLTVFSLLVLLITLIIAHYIEPLIGVGKLLFPSPVSQNFIAESLKILGAAIFAGFVALLVTNVWQQKSIGFDLLKELNSQEFFEVRNILSAQKKISLKEGIDIDDINYWFPRGKYDTDKEIIFYTKEGFTRAHALPSMIYFVVRLSNYAKNGMLNIRVTKNLFNVFFVHYRILILEFAYAFEKYYENTYSKNPQSYTEIKNNMWLIRVKDIKFFFYVIGLDSELPACHEYEYFPSLNKNYDNSKLNCFATDIDLNIYVANKKDTSINTSTEKGTSKNIFVNFIAKYL